MKIRLNNLIRMEINKIDKYEVIFKNKNKRLKWNDSK